MTKKEKARLVEILFYWYFYRQDAKTFEDTHYWELIKAFCTFYGLSNIILSQTLKTLFLPANKVTEIETIYLFNLAGLSVREIYRITGIYWQKQKKYLETINATTYSCSFPVITDAAKQEHMVSFIKSMFDMCAVFTDIDEALVEDTK